jgi:LacI family repressor for deo operon, udp, cdd, tsx, nupC, and nupG
VEQGQTTAGLVHGRSRTGRVAVVLPRLDAWFYSTMVASMAPVLRNAELDLLLYQVEGGGQRTRLLRELSRRREVDAVILTAIPMTPDEVDRVELLGVHVVVAGGTLHDHPYVRVDDLEAGRLAAQHLVDLGHRRIAMIRTSDTDGTYWSSDVRRVRAWRETLAGAGLEPSDELLVTETYGLEAGARAMVRLLELADPPTAVFAYSDELALAALTQARRNGLRVPEDLSIVGVDGHPFGELAGLTTVDQGVPAQGRLAADLAARLIAGEQVTGVDLPVRLHVRGTTGPWAG